MITKLDSDIGRILAAIDDNPALRSNTLVIVTSDNGPHNADGHSSQFFNSSGGLRGVKFSLYEGGIRVPCIMRWPGTITPGAVCDVPCGFVDIAPTLRELAGSSASIPPTDGVSLLPLLAGASRLARPVPLLWYAPPPSPFDSTVAAMLTNQWKFILLADGTPELYDLNRDPAETTNRAPEHPALIRACYSLLTRQLRQPLPPLLPRRDAGPRVQNVGRAATPRFTSAFWSLHSDLHHPLESWRRGGSCLLGAHVFAFFALFRGQ